MTQARAVRNGMLLAWLVPGIAAAYLVAAYATIWLIDIRQAFGGPPRLEAAGLWPPFAWVQLFMGGGLTEIFQWALLATLVILAAGISASYRAGRWPGLPEGIQQARARFWVLVAVAAALMLIEDAGNPRHLIHHYAVVASNAHDRFTTLVEAAYFAAILSIGVYGFLRYGRYLLALPPVRLLGLLGVGLYALSMLMNLTRRSGEWYTAFGGWLVEDVLRAPQMLEAVAMGPLDPQGLDIRFFIVDFVIEESLELLGAAFLVAAVLAYLGLLRGASVAPERAVPADGNSGEPGRPTGNGTDIDTAEHEPLQSATRDG